MDCRRKLSYVSKHRKQHELLFRRQYTSAMTTLMVSLKQRNTYPCLQVYGGNLLHCYYLIALMGKFFVEPRQSSINIFQRMNPWKCMGNVLRIRSHIQLLYFEYTESCNITACHDSRIIGWDIHNTLLFFLRTSCPAKNASYLELPTACYFFNNYTVNLHRTLLYVSWLKNSVFFHSKSFVVEVESWLICTFSFVVMVVMCLAGITFQVLEFSLPTLVNKI